VSDHQLIHLRLERSQ